ncbi:hypothetical protein VNI00_015682 [Paramarasmius palmivorus]|uniref:F-box domain-containing protein n=1 Tax=Paramarasmius palmivorus TaxID=297713 RepID=A0AAW0BIM2_9AGAR
MSLFNDAVRDDPGPDNFLCTSYKTRILPTISFPSVPLAALRSNYIPSNNDITRTVSILQEEELELQRYNEEIQRVRRTLEEENGTRSLERLDDEQEMLRKKMKERRSWLAPIRRLPIEILASVFIEVSRDSPLWIGHVRYPLRPGISVERFAIQAVALDLSHVSSHWRNLAIAQRSIWSRIKLDIPRIPKDVTPLIHLYLNNASEHSLFLYIRDLRCEIGSMPTLEKVEEYLGVHSLACLRVLTSEFSRCKVLSVYEIPPEVLLHASDKEISFPVLHKLVCYWNYTILHYQGTFPINANNRFWKAIHDAPLLKRVLVDRLGPFRHAECIPWSQLTLLSVDEQDIYDQNFHSILARCCSLKFFELEQNDCFGNASSSVFQSSNGIEPRVVLPYLRKVHLSNVTSTITQCILASLTLPSLALLKVQVNEPSASSPLAIWDFQPLYSLVSRSSSSCGLTSLSLDIRAYAIDDDAFALFSKILVASPALEYLKMITQTSQHDKPGGASCSTVYSLFSLLSFSSNNTSRTVLPKLKDIQLHEHQVTPNTHIVEAVLDAVEIRTDVRLQAIGRADVSGLRNVHVCMLMDHDCQGTEERTFSCTPTFQERIATIEGGGTKCSVLYRYEV